jgi:hypothetical protein
MNLFGKQNKKEYVAAILLRHGDGQAYLLETIETTRSIKLIDQRAFNFTNGWDNLTYDVDELLFNLENDHKIELKKTAFFVYSHLIDLHTRDITSPYKEFLEKIIKDNELESLGYLEMDQIISKYLAVKEGSPLSATVIEIDTPAVSVFMYQAGELVFSESVARSENIVSDLTELFQHTHKDTMLPTRLVMYDSHGLEDEASKIISHKWPKDVFMHVPKVDIINEMDFTNAILQASPEYVFSHTEVHSDAIPDAVVAPESTTVPEDLGFVVGADVKKDKLPEPVGYDVYESPMQVKPSMSGGSIFGKVRSLIKIPQMPMLQSSRKKPLIIALIGLLIVVIGLGAGLYYAHAATLTVYYESSEISEEVNFDKADFIEKKAEKIDVEASVETTGTKKIGEKASGSITIFNATESDKTFKKGTKLSAPNKLVFVLNSDVTVKAATKTVTGSGDILTTTSKEKAEATAEDIGTTYNLAKDTKFTFDGSSDTTYFAKANDAFTGGTEKEIQTASKEDFSRIEKEIQKQINQKKADALKQGSDAHKVLSELTEIELVKEDYSKEVAEEAKTLDAKVTAEVTYYLYDEATVKKALVEALADKIPDNYELTPDKVTFTVSSSEKTDDGINLTLEAKGEPSYKIDQGKIIGLIKGKSTGSVEKILKENTDTKGFSMDVASPIPFFKFFTPFFDKNYKITTEPLQ